MKLGYIYALIIIECRLNKKQACLLFNKTEEELDGIFRNLECSYPTICRALKYIFNYETVMFDEHREKKSLFLGKFYLRKLSNILKNKDALEREKELEQFVLFLSGPDISGIINKKFTSLTEEEKKLALKYQLKYAISNVMCSKLFDTNHETIHNYAKKVQDEEIKRSYAELHEYYANQTPNYIKYCVKKNRKR